MESAQSCEIANTTVKLKLEDVFQNVSIYSTTPTLDLEVNHLVTK